MIADHERRHRRKIAKLHVREFHVPTHLAVLGVQADQVRVRRREVQPVLVHSQPAMPDVIALGLPLVVPNFAAKTRIHRPNIVRRRQIKDSIHFQRRRFEHVSMRPKCPGQRQRIDVLSTDLVQRAVARSRIVSVVGRPSVCRRLQQRCSVQPLRRCDRHSRA